MKAVFVELWQNESGLVLSAEMVLILTIAVLGVVVGLSEVSTAIVYEFQDLALAFYGLNQSYSTPTFAGCLKWSGRTSFHAGSGYWDFYNGCVGPGVLGSGGYGGGGGSTRAGGYTEYTYNDLGLGTSINTGCGTSSTTTSSDTCIPCMNGGTSPTPLPASQLPTLNSDAFIPSPPPAAK